MKLKPGCVLSCTAAVAPNRGPASISRGFVKKPPHLGYWDCRLDWWDCRLDWLVSKLQRSTQSQKRPDMGSSTGQGLAYRLVELCSGLRSVTAPDHYLDWLGCMPDLWASMLQAEQWHLQLKL